MALLALLVLLHAAAAEAVQSSTVYIIRHGEKNNLVGCLSDEGEARANSLNGVFNGQASPDHPTFETPLAIFANRYEDPVDCERCKQTVLPIATALSLPVVFDYGYPLWVSGNSKSAAAIKEAAAATPVVLVAWEHNNIKALAEYLGVAKADIPAWPSGDFDSDYSLTLDGEGTVVSFVHEAQNFTRGGEVTDAAAADGYKLT